MKNVIKRAIDFAVAIAYDDSHGYDQIYRWGEKGDYDCSSLVITAFEQAGIPVKTNGATYTGNMRSVFLKCGFTDVTDNVNRATGAGLQPGDVLLNTVHHTALVVTENGRTIVHASINENGTAKNGKPGDQTGGEICTRNYYNKPWDCVLRYIGDDVNVDAEQYVAVGTAEVSDTLNVRSFPSTSGTKIGEFAAGDVIYITGKCNNGWYRCLISGGVEGYVCGDYVGNIKEEARVTEKNETPVTNSGTMIYNYIDKNMPEWARPAVQWCVDNKIVQGTGEGLNLDDAKLWQCVTLYRLAHLNS